MIDMFSEVFCHIKLMWPLFLTQRDDKVKECSKKRFKREREVFMDHANKRWALGEIWLKIKTIRNFIMTLSPEIRDFHCRSQFFTQKKFRSDSPINV